jgi:hypothetical protein
LVKVKINPPEFFPEGLLVSSRQILISLEFRRSCGAERCFIFKWSVL